MRKHQVVLTALVALLLGASFSTPAYSYLDPGTGSIILQAILAAVAAAAMALKFYWHRITTFFTRKGRSSGDDTVPLDKDR